MDAQIGHQCLLDTSTCEYCRKFSRAARRRQARRLAKQREEERFDTLQYLNRARPTSYAQVTPSLCWWSEYSMYWLHPFVGNSSQQLWQISKTWSTKAEKQQEVLQEQQEEEARPEQAAEIPIMATERPPCARMALLQHWQQAKAQAGSNVTHLPGNINDDRNLDWNHPWNADFIIHFIFHCILCIDNSVNNTHITQHTPEHTNTRRRRALQPEERETLKSDIDKRKKKNKS